jgi:gp40 protein
MEESKRIIEIDGVKVEIDLRTAKRVESFKVGDNIKILDKEYDTYKVKPGIIVDFAEFQELPTIVIAVFEEGSWSSAPNISFIYYNKNTSKKVEIVSCSEDEIKVSKEGVIERFEREIQKKKNEYEDLKNKLEYFKTHFLKVYKEI